MKNLSIYKTAVTYSEEFNHYIEENVDFDKYYNQLCEIDARAYEKIAADNYYAKINAYLDSLNQKEYIQK